MLSTKDLVFKERPTKKLTERYMGPYKIEKVVSKNVVIRRVCGQTLVGLGLGQR